jgi:hypothetical protein
MLDPNTAPLLRSSKELGVDVVISVYESIADKRRSAEPEMTDDEIDTADNEPEIPMAASLFGFGETPPQPVATPKGGILAETTRYLDGVLSSSISCNPVEFWENNKHVRIIHFYRARAQNSSEHLSNIPVFTVSPQLSWQCRQHLQRWRGCFRS